MPRKSKKPVRKQTQLAYGQGSWPSRSDTATDDSWDRGHEGGSDGMGVRARTDSSGTYCSERTPRRSRGSRASTRRSELITTGGSTNGELSFGGRRIQVSRTSEFARSRARRRRFHTSKPSAKKTRFPPERVLNQILVGVSTRNYESSLDKPAAKLKSRGTSKSAASRHPS